MTLENMKLPREWFEDDFSDTVLLPSERMREIYIDRLTEPAGEDTRRMWEEKMLSGVLQKS